jgi:hypothetical protein
VIDTERLRALAEQSQHEVAARFSLALEGEAVVALCDEVERLKRDISYLNPMVESLQPIGRALGLLAGADLTRECVPAIERLRAERNEAMAVARDMLTFIERDIPPEHARHAEPEMRAARKLLAKERK